MELVLVWLVFSVVWAGLSALAAERRNRSRGNWFVAGLILGPFAFIAVLVMEEGQAPYRKPSIDEEEETERKAAEIWNRTHPGR